MNKMSDRSGVERNAQLDMEIAGPSRIQNSVERIAINGGGIIQYRKAYFFPRL